MADKQTDEPLEDVPSNEDDSKIAAKGLSKATLLKIAIGVLVLIIIAGGAYYFFMMSDEPIAEETDAEVIEQSIPPELSALEPVEPLDALEAPSTDENLAIDRAQLLKMREEADALKAENLKMKEQLTKLEAQQKSNVGTVEAAISDSTVNNTASENDDKKSAEITTKPKTKTNQYSNLYSRDYAITREPRREPTPPPEPKWGDFDPLYRGK